MVRRVPSGVREHLDDAVPTHAPALRQRRMQLAGGGGGEVRHAMRLAEQRHVHAGRCGEERLERGLGQHGGHGEEVEDPAALVVHHDDAQRRDGVLLA